LTTLFGESARAANLVFDLTAVSQPIHTLANEVTRALFTTPNLTKLFTVVVLGTMIGGGAILLQITGRCWPTMNLQCNTPKQEDQTMQKRYWRWRMKHLV
jgi:hypothetical protein